MTALKSYHRSVRPRLGTALWIRSSLRQALDPQNVGLILTGAAIGLLFVGFGERMYLVLGYTPRAYAVSVPLLATALSAGIWIACRSIKTRQGKGRRMANAHSADRRAVIGSLAKLSAALIIFVLPNWITVAEAVRDSMFAAFLWSRESIVILDSVVASIAALPLVIVGAILANQDRGATRHGGLTRTATMVAGGGIALILLGTFGDVDLVVRAGVRLAAAPLLLSSVWIVARRQPPDPPPRRTIKVDAILEPELRDRWPTLLRLTVGITVICAAVAGAMWTHVATVMQAGSFPVTLAAAGLAILGVAIGLHTANREDDAGRRIADCGAACAVGGIALAAAMLIFGAVNLVAESQFRQSFGFAGLFLACLLPVTILIGRAVGFTELAVLRRSDADQSSPRFDCALLICGSIGLSMITWLSIRFMGSFTALAAIALTLLSVGGVLMIHDPAGEIEGRRRRVAMTFVAIMAMTVTLPLVQGGWLRNRQFHRADIVETWWAAMAKTPEGTAVLFARALRKGGIGYNTVRDTTNLGGDDLASVAPAGFASHHNGFDCDGLNPTFGEDPRLGWMDRLSRDRDRYAGLTIVLSELPDDLIRRICSAGGLDAALARLVPGGRLTLVMPNRESGADMRWIILARFERCGAKCVRQFMLETNGPLAIEFNTEKSRQRVHETWRQEAVTRSAIKIDPRIAAASP